MGTVRTEDCKFLTIVRTEPSFILDNSEEDCISIDSDFSIIFDDSILKDSLKNENFKIYVESTYEQVPLDIFFGKDEKGRTQDNKVILKPKNGLRTDTDYILFIRGDTHLKKGMPKGVISKTGAVLSENTNLFFKSGTGTSNVDCDLPNEIVVETFENMTESCDTVEQPKVITDPAIIEKIINSEFTDNNKEIVNRLELEFAYPNHQEIGIDEFSQIELSFNDEIDWAKYGIYETSEETETELLDSVRTALKRIFVIRRNPLPFDCNPRMTNVENLSYMSNLHIKSLNIETITLSINNEITSNIIPNSEYVVGIRDSSLKGKNTKPVAKTEVKFLSTLAPAYASISQFDMRIPDNLFDISEYDKHKLIAEYSELLIMRYNGRVLEGPQLCAIANKFVLCSISNDLLNSYRDSVAGLRSREQFGLAVAYNTTALGAKQYGPYDQCVQDTLISLDAQTGVGVAIGIKSGNTNWYMGRRRGVRTNFEGFRDGTVPHIHDPDTSDNNYAYRKK